MSIKLLNAIAGAMAGGPKKPSGMSDAGADSAENSAMATPAGKRPYKKPLPGQHDGDGDGDDDMAQDHQMGAGERFGIDELEQHLCRDCHDNIKRVAASRGGQRGEHA